MVFLMNDSLLDRKMGVSADSFPQVVMHWEPLEPLALLARISHHAVALPRLTTRRAG
jgi:hypothetical protein